MDAGTLTSLLDKYGIPIVAIAMLAVAVGVLFKLLLSAKDSQNKAAMDALTASHKVAVDVLQQALEGERTARRSADARLESNSTALKEATVGFSAALALLDKLADRDARDERPRPAARR